MLSSTLCAFAFVLLEPLDRVRLQGRFQGRDACFAQRRGSAATSALTTAVRSQLCRVESPSCAGVADHQQLMRVQTLYKKCLLPIVCRRRFYVSTKYLIIASWLDAVTRSRFNRPTPRTPYNLRQN